MNDETKTTENGTGDFMRLWFEMAGQMAEACQKLTDSPLSPDSIRQGRSEFFKMGSEYAENFLRSPSVLESQNKCFTGSLANQKQVRENLARLCHEMQLASTPDIDQLMIAMRRLGEDLREHFEELSGQLNNLSKQLSGLERRMEALEKRSSPEERPASNHQPRRKTNGKRKIPLRMK
jgi:hypothetical protein